MSGLSIGGAYERIYGYRKIHCDLRDVGEQCGQNRVYRLMRAAGLRAQVGYRRPGHR